MIRGISSIFTSFNWAHCDGNFLYVVYTHNGLFGNHSYYLNIYDITNPGAPEEIGKIELTGVNSPVDVTVHNNYAYAASPQHLDIIDIQDKTDPFVAGICSGFSNI